MAPRKRGLGSGLSVLIPSTGSNNAAIKQLDEVAKNSTKTLKSAGVAKGLQQIAVSEDNTRKPSVRDLTAKKPKSAQKNIKQQQDLVKIGDVAFAEVSVFEIKPSPDQNRVDFDEEALQALAGSIKQHGLMEPIRIKPLKKPEGEVKYQLIAGERRLRASKIAKIDTILSIIDDPTDEKAAIQTLIENFQRVDLNPLEEAAGYAMIMNNFGYTQEQVALTTNQARASVANSLRLLKAPQKVQDKIRQGVLSKGHAKVVLGLQGADLQEKFSDRIVKEGMTVRQAELQAAMLTHTQKAQKNPANKTKNTPDFVVAANELAQKIAHSLDTEATVKITKSERGSLQIEFADLADLNRIQQQISHK